MLFYRGGGGLASSGESIRIVVFKSVLRTPIFFNLTSERRAGLLQTIEHHLFVCRVFPFYMAVHATTVVRVELTVLSTSCPEEKLDLTWFESSLCTCSAGSLHVA